MRAGRPSRPPRPLPLSVRRQVFIEEIIGEALLDGLVVQCDVSGEEGSTYALTPAGETWLRDLPVDMLLFYPVDRECGDRA